MLISSDEGAGQIVSSDEETRFYDDIGCLAADWAAHRGSATAFVHLKDGGWSDAAIASYARPTSARTAMGSGLAAFATAAAARAADRSSQSLTWDEVVKLRGEPR
jgi:hypothetical protein